MDSTKRFLGTAAVIGLVAVLSACSSSKKGDAEDIAGSDEIPLLDSETDDLPIDDADLKVAEADTAPGAGSKPDAALTEDTLAAGDPFAAGAPAEPMAAGVDPMAADPMTDPMADSAMGADPFAAPQPEPEAFAAAPAPAPGAFDAPPAPAPAPAAAHLSNGSGQFENYTFQRGDTLMKLAFETYGDVYQWRRILDNNRDVITNPNALAPGTVLKLEKPMSAVVVERNGESYLIKRGDTLGTISDDIYGTIRKWRKLWENNRQLIKDPNKIFAGFYLYYTMTEQERQEAEQRRQHQELTVPPLATAPAEEVTPGTFRDPAAMDPAMGEQALAPQVEEVAPAMEQVVQ